MKLLTKLRYAYECGQEKADLVYKVVNFKQAFDDPIYNEVCNNLAETEEKEREYGFLESVAFGIGYSKGRKIIRLFN